MVQSTIQEHTRMFGDIEEIIDDVEKRFNEFKKFDVLRIAPKDHRFYQKILSSSRGTSIFQSSGKHQKFQEKIQKEWVLLQENLPDFIFVRGYSDADFMRAVIINPPNSPFYSNGLFFFDIFFPPNYPSSPPKIHYIDDNDLNMIPNIDAIGKWEKTSTILDGLVTIKDRIINAKPILNDGLRSYIFPVSGSVKHVKKALFLHHKGMLNLLTCPPSDFDVFVKGFFRTRAHIILLNYRYCLDDVGGDDELILLFLELYKTFESNGTYCKHHLVHVDKFMRQVQQVQHSKDKQGGVVSHLMRGIDWKTPTIFELDSLLLS